ncbi:MAG TPA: hypothetical protein VNF99_13510, partial [Stellaceae bacterium]|nr:hypothetical protein [Stellaceae bacterium]
MQVAADFPQAPTAIRTDLVAIFVSLELSRSTWLITSLSPGSGEKMSKHSVRGGNVAGLLERLFQLQEKALARTEQNFSFIVIQEARVRAGRRTDQSGTQAGRLRHHHRNRRQGHPPEEDRRRFP